MCDMSDHTHPHAHGRLLSTPLSEEATRRQILKALGLSPALMILASHEDAWALEAPQSSLQIVNGYRILRSNGIPNHPTGSFPNRRNPHQIRAQNHEFRIPLTPQRRGQPRPYDHSSFGVALNGIPFDPFTAEYYNRDRRSNWRYEALSGKIDLGLDGYNAHVQPDGSYHYHGIPKGLITRWSPNAHSPLIGYAADGFPIYILNGYNDPRNPQSGVRKLRPSYRLKSGQRPDGPGGTYDGTFVADYDYVPGLGDLDEANGRETVTKDYPQGTYAYFLTDSFPFIPRSFAGTPDASFAKGPPQGGSRRGGPSHHRRSVDGPPPRGNPPHPRHPQNRRPRPPWE